jgi:hypothetical protein
MDNGIMEMKILEDMPKHRSSDIDIMEFDCQKKLPRTTTDIPFYGNMGKGNRGDIATNINNGEWRTVLKDDDDPQDIVLYKLACDVETH